MAQGRADLAHASQDELTKVSVEKQIQNPLMNAEDRPLREDKNPARFKTAVLKVKLPPSHDKFKANIQPHQSEVVQYTSEETKSFYKNKPLHEFDCFEDDKRPEEWLKICSEMSSIAHAHTLIYENYEYIWKPCQVQGFNPDNTKYLIKVLHTGVRKEVVRLSLRFIQEDAEVFNRRMDLCKYLRNQAESEYRLKNYIELIPGEKVTNMSKPLKARIFNKVVESLPKIEITDHVEYFVKLKRELEKSYLDSQKKFLVETEMKNPHNHGKYESQNIIIKNAQEFVPDFGIIRLKKSQDQDETQLLKLDDVTRTEIEKRVSTLCYDYLDEEILKLDYNKVALPINILEFDKILVDNYNKIQYRLTQNWRYKINEELKKYYFEKNNRHRHEHNYFKMSKEDEDVIEAHIIKINFFLNNQLRQYVKFLLDSGIAFYCQFSNTAHVSYCAPLTINQMIEDRYVHRHETPELNDHQEVFRLYKRIEEVKTPLLQINLVSSSTQDSMLESKFVKYMCYQPDLITIKKSLMKYVDYIKDLSETIEKIDSNELKLRESVSKRLLYLFLKPEDYKNMKTFPWFTSAYEQLSKIVENCINDLIENILKYKEFDDILNIKDNDTYTFFKNFRENLQVENKDDPTPEDLSKQQLYRTSRHSAQAALNDFSKTLSRQKTSESQLKRKKSKSDFEKEKREADKLAWRDENCDNPSSSYLKQEIEKYRNYISRLKQINSIVIDKNMFRIDITELKEKIHSKCNGINDEIYRYINETTDKEMSQVLNKLTEVYEKLKNVPDEETKLRELENYLEHDFSRHMLMFEARYDNAKELLTVLEDTGFDYSKETQKKQFSIQGKQCLIAYQLGICRRTRVSIKEKLSKKLEDEIIGFEHKFKKLRDNIDAIKIRNNYDNFEMIFTKIQDYNEELQKSLKESVTLEDRCRFLEFEARLPPTKDIDKTKDEFHPYVELWRLIYEYNKFKLDCLEVYELKYLQKEGVDARFKEMLAKSSKIKKVFEQKAEESGDELPILDVTEKFHLQLSGFNEKLLPLVNYLGNEAIEASHWEEIKALTGIAVMERLGEESVIYLKHIQDIDTQTYKLDLEDISTKASKQHKIKKDMQKMEDQLKERELSIEPYNDNQYYILKDSASVTQDLDDKIQNLQAMRNYPDINLTLKNNCTVMCTKLEKFSRVLSNWVRFQKTWFYLEPVFSSEDIKEQLKAEAYKFEHWNRQWVDRMKESNMDKKVWSHIEIDSLEELFLQGNEVLDEIQKSMEVYLNKKRLHFSRFYLVSDETLIEILAKTKDPQKVQPHLEKVFDSVVSLVFDNAYITTVVSAEGEQVKLWKNVTPEEGEFRGNVEKWMKDLEVKLKKTLKDETYKCLNAFEKKTSLFDWIKQWPAMCLNLCEQLIWTAETEKSFRRILESKDAMVTHLQLYQTEVEELLELAKTKVSPNERSKLVTLLTLKEHERRTNEMLIKRRVNDEYDYEWKKLMRFYYDNKESAVKMAMIDIYNSVDYEYLGTSRRIVVTPLTQRVQQTIYLAKQHLFGGSCEGPAAVGKSETVKELATSLGLWCISYNCSATMDQFALAKFFKGLCGTGSFCCLEDFNKVSSAVLSVLAMQINEIFESVKTHRNQFTFFGSEGIKLVESVSINITMNPSYQGRTELTDNLKSIFRTCAMMRPDVELIIEFRLFAAGYSECKRMTSKISKTVQLCAELFSPQRHYDFSLRTVVSILELALAYKLSLNASEDVMILKAVTEVVTPKLLQADLALFKEILRDLFPGETLPDVKKVELENAIQEVCHRLQLVCNDKYLEKCVHLFDTMMSRSGSLILGDSCVGKSSLLKVTSEAISSLAGSQNFKKVETVFVAPKSVPYSKLVGSFNEQQVYQYGVAAKIYKKILEPREEDLYQVVVFDGSMDPEWTEDLHSLLDRNSKLCLASGDFLNTTPHVKTVFECDQLEHSTPSLVSRLGVVYLESKSIGWYQLYKSKGLELLALFQSCPNYGYDEDKVRLLTELLYYMLNPVMSWFEKYTSPAVYMTKNALVVNYFRLLFMLLREKFSQLQDAESKTKVKADLLKIEAEVKNIMLFALVYAFGGLLHYEDREKYNAFIGDLVKSKVDMNATYKLYITEEWIFDDKMCAKMQVHEDYFNCALDVADFSKLIPWERTMTKTTLDTSVYFHEVYIVTKETIKASYFFQLFMKFNESLCLSGGSGSGKTKLLQNEVRSICSNPENEKSHLNVRFTAKSKVETLQDYLEGFLTQRIRQGRFAPAENKHAIIFIDDLNLPSFDCYDTQATSDLLRSWMDYQGWFSVKSDEREFNQFTKIQFCASANFTQNRLQERLVRHFGHMHLGAYSNESLYKIYSLGIDYIFSVNEYNPEFLNMRSKIVDAVITLYADVAKIFKPKPISTQYQYKLADINRVLECMMTAETETILKQDDLVKLWIHETERVYKDRLVKEDVEVFTKIMAEVTKKVFNAEYHTLSNEGFLWFGSFVDEHNYYREFADKTLLKQKCNEFLIAYNQEAPMAVDVCLFDQAVVRLCNFCRLMRIKNGHGILVANEGSARKTLLTLGSFIMKHEMVRFDYNTRDKHAYLGHWHAVLQYCCFNAGAEEKGTTLLITEQNLAYDELLDDLNNIMMAGELPYLFEKLHVVIPESLNLKAEIKKDDILSKMQEKERLGGSKTNSDSATLLNWFFDLVCCNLSVFVLQSPAHPQLKQRVCSYPAFTAKAYYNILNEWPEESLLETGHYLLYVKAVHEGDSDEDKKDSELSAKVISIASDMHASVKELSEQYLAAERRFNYVSINNFVEMMTNFNRYYQSYTAKVNENCIYYKKGVENLEKAQNEVETLQKNIDGESPILLKMREVVVAEKEKIDQAIEKTSEQEKTVQEKRLFAETKKQEIEDEKLYIEEEINKTKPIVADSYTKIKRVDEKQMEDLFKQSSGTKKMEEVLELFVEIWKIKVQKIKIEEEESKDKGQTKKVKSYYKTCKLMNKQVKIRDELVDFPKNDLKYYPDIFQAIIPKFKEINKEEVGKIHLALVGIYEFVSIMIYFFDVDYKLEPARKSLKEKSDQMTEILADLSATNNTYEQSVAGVEQLKENMAEKQTKLQDFELKMDTYKNRLERASKLTEGLKSEKPDWISKSTDYEARKLNLLGDVLISCGIISFLSAFSFKWRDLEVAKWKKILFRSGIAVSADVSLRETLGSQYEIQSWSKADFQMDSVSVENAVLMTLSQKTTLCIDPEGQFTQFIKKKLEAEDVKLVKINSVGSNPDSDLKNIKLALKHGWSLLVENVHASLNPLLENIAYKRIFKKNGATYIMLENEELEYHADFRVYLTTCKPNTKFSLDIYINTCVIDCTACHANLTEQFRNKCIEVVDKKIFDQYLTYEKEMAEQTLLKFKIEKEIIKEINNADIELLDNQNLVNSIEESEKSFNTIKKYENQFKTTKKRYEELKRTFEKLSEKVAHMWYVLVELNLLNIAYLWSVEWYKDIFVLAIKRNIKDRDRIESDFKDSLYEQVSVSLFEQDKVVFSLLLSLRLMEVEKILDHKLLSFVLSGGSWKENKSPMPDVPNREAFPWFTEQVWISLEELSATSDLFAGFANKFAANIQQYDELVKDKHSFSRIFPGLADNIDKKDKKTRPEVKEMFMKLLVVRLIKPSYLIPAIRQFVEKYFDSKKFSDAAPLNLKNIYQMTKQYIPIMFLLKPGVEPLLDIVRFSKEYNLSDEALPKRSLGKGNDAATERALIRAREKGHWIILQNCQMGPSFMPILEAKLFETTQIIKANENKKHSKKKEEEREEEEEEEEETKIRIDPKFRFWITTQVDEHFPSYVIQNSIKLSYETPRGIRANATRCLSTIEKNYFNEFEEEKGTAIRKLLFGLSIFHGVLCERKKFGSLGFNQEYNFGLSDFEMSKDLLKTMVALFHDLQFQAMAGIMAEVTYGGKISDPMDRRLLSNIFSDLFTEDIMDSSFKLKQTYSIPDLTSLDDWKNHALNLDANLESLKLYDLHPSLEVLVREEEFDAFNQSLHSISPQATQEWSAKNELNEWDSTLNNLLNELPEAFILEEVARLKPITRENSLNVILNQDAQRYNTQLAIIRHGLSSLRQAIRGATLIDDNGRQMLHDLKLNSLPAAWKAQDDSSCRYMKQYLSQLVERYEVFKQWIYENQPFVFYMPIFMFPSGFLTAVLQNYSRSSNINMELLEFDFKFPKAEPAERAPVGEYIKGFYLEGAGWDVTKSQLTDVAVGKEGLVFIPCIQLVPVLTAEKDKSRSKTYQCPMYRNRRRQSTLSTSGHSSNFILSVDLPISDAEDITHKKYILGSVALIAEAKV